uniref:sugar diacid recognition domain-containing protein n=1 Tax=Aeromonas media TaxID=651 RepID=UPI00224090F4
MQPNDTLVRQIASRAMKILSFPVKVINESSLIIAFGNPLLSIRRLNDTLARQIVSRAMKILSFPVKVMDESCLIIASGNPLLSIRRCYAAQ